MTTRQNPLLSLGNNNSQQQDGTLVTRRTRQEPRKIPGKKSPVPPLGERQLEELMRLAEYEILQDPYRGLAFLAGQDNDDGKNTKKIVTPWDACQWGILSMPKPPAAATEDESANGIIHEDGSMVLDPENPDNLVRTLTESSCPSLVAWTQQRLEETKKKRQQNNNKKGGKKRNRATTPSDTDSSEDPTLFPRLGFRPLDKQFRCPCDSNPFCLGSMGGLVNDLLQERCQRGITVAIPDDDEEGNTTTNGETTTGSKRAKITEPSGSSNENSSKGVDSNKSSLIEIVNIDEVTKPGEVDTESEETTTSVFAFMGGKSKPSNKILNFLTNNKRDTVTETKATPEVQSTTLTCKPLGPKLTQPATGNPAEVFTAENNLSNQHLDQTEYSKGTKDEIDKLRRCEDVELSKIETFVNESILVPLFNTNAQTMKVDEYIQTMIEWHKSLIFVDPTREERSVKSNQITIALPPGIQNLGATCYLNTQLQCLAQNPVFLDGIFSWRPVNSTHKMNGVMTKLQKLLAQMLVGGDRTYTSLNFSNALGIQHNEQQDPNEFARLLFDRMEESFQQCSNSRGAGLGRLLQRIFHGTTTYETICMKCGKTSVRSEGFMDLNLPIVQKNPNDVVDPEDMDTDTPETIEIDNANDGKQSPAFTSKRKRQKKGTIESAFRKQRNKVVGTDVQHCFDQYTKTEILDGDNQYLCDACESKQDAKRVMKLTELPPVLNIQLSRYVFDREKFMKKKLTDKVRLPTVLSIDRHPGACSDSSSGTSSKRKQAVKKHYLLCAVMRHQGTSAYSGHYVAEAMDWTTGQWYEFNDESVTVLPSPSNSYVPDEFVSTEETMDETAPKSTGSQDAYNMYYVDEDYLAENAMATVFRYERLNSSGTGCTDGVSSKDDCVLGTLIQEKVNRDSVLTELCAVDYAISDRLRRRKNGIRKYMFVDPTSLLIDDGLSRDNQEPCFWVYGKILRDFLACDRSLDDKLLSDEPIVCPKSLLCPHGCLRPEIAIQGKLLRKSMYEAYVSLLAGERRVLSMTSEAQESDIVGCVITPDDKLICKECSDSHCKELSNKLDLLRDINNLYVEILDETKDSLKNGHIESSDDSLEDQYSCIVSRSSITKFKKLVVDLMKSTADFRKGGTWHDSKTPLILNGINDIDLSCFPGMSTSVDSAIPDCNGSTDKGDSIDEKFNSKITCSHGNCSDFSKRSVRYVPYEAWAKIKKIFPKAIEHRILMSIVDGKMRKPNTEEDGCRECREEKDAMNNLTADIERWAKGTKENFALKKLLDGKKISPGEIAFHNFDSAHNNCRLVHRDDIGNLCISVKSLGHISKCKTHDNVGLKNFVETLAFPSYHSVVLDFEKQPDARLLQSLRSLICCEHRRVVKSAIIDSLGKDEELPRRYQLSNEIVVLSEEEYNAYINALADLLAILNCGREQQNVLQGNNPTLLEGVKKLAASCHPAIKMKMDENLPSDETLLFSLDGNSKEFSIMPAICDRETCKKDFIPSIQKPAKEFVDSVSVDSAESTGKRTKESGRNMDCKPGSIAMHPIIVESDLEDFANIAENTHKIRVFKYKEGSNLTDALQSLTTALGLTNGDDSDNTNLALRRSTRRRKVHFPVGCITDEEKVDIGLHHNIAALRLLLYQYCQIPLGCKLGFALRVDDSSPLYCRDIAFNWGEMTLHDLIDQLELADESLREIYKASASDHFFLLFQIDKTAVGGDVEATLMDQLIQMSNMDSFDATNNSSKRKKARRNASERGFQGTLLQSSTGSGPTEETKDSGDDDESCTKVEAGPIQNQGRMRSNTIISDDDAEESPKRTTIDDDKNILSDDGNDSSDGEVAIVPSPPPRIAARSAIGDNEKMRLVSQLNELTSNRDESACFEAVTWAIASYPKYEADDVIDAALEQFFHLKGS